MGVSGAIAVSAGVGLYASDKAAKAQKSAANQSSSDQKWLYNQQKKDNEPWRGAGINALNNITSNLGDYTKDFSAADFQADPGYAFRVAEGQKALERSAAARGGLNSGATLKALDRYSQGVASDEYQNVYNRFNNDRTQRFNRLSSVAGIGQTANQQMGQASQNYANAMSENAATRGNIAAAQAGATANAVGQGMNTWMQYQMLNQNKQPSIQPTGSVGGSYNNYSNAG